MECGPFKIEIIEPMMSLRVTLDDNESGVSADLLWIPRTASFAEEHQRLISERGEIDVDAFTEAHDAAVASLLFVPKEVRQCAAHV